ncbi:cysteine--tRNA ligase [Fructobacillus sp. M1-13]|uniref:Cysteine--tRNA ligase n=1 Tax=Fructobacillus papyriferae TaxID=2713171 RepID=A0ABS5QUA4_9LACO|nr:cysteine--tRNA ligase [Fructobacillus papyriferae]MBS9335517.1 cysteine--tRNA ligase [Fructobacillus papyriferae]MCD2159287.1 cysteine--tRNA ligase [Fructobacillus papyriferae]
MQTVYNTYTLEKERFTPIEEGKVRFYLCGPTVYNYIHIGNARSSAAFDTIRKYLEWRGYSVDFVSNFTDLGDKVIAQGEKEGLSEEEVADKYADAFLADVAALNIAPATTRPRATQYMEEMVAFVEKLMAQGQAYEVNGDVYFRTDQFKNYAVLSHQNMAELKKNAAGRLDNEDQEEKENDTDFALWKKEERPDVTSWPSPWGPGRPGWHLECSVMIDSLLGDTIDIHAGGIDLAFPHHTNELAQSESYHDERFVNYWLHNGFVNVNDEKMSKSLGNFVTIHDLLADDNIDPQGLRYFLSKTHYRRPVAYSRERLDQAQQEVDKIYRTMRALAKAAGPAGELDSTTGAQLQLLDERFMAAMDDDFNVENALTVVFEGLTLANRTLQEKKNQKTFALLREKLVTWLHIFGLDDFEEKRSLSKKAQAILEERAAARKEKDFEKSDELRDQLKEMGILVKDGRDGQSIEWM